MSNNKLEDLGYKDVKAYCPECEELVMLEADHEVSCSDCGSHEAVQCVNCGEYFDSVYGYGRIIKYNKERDGKE